VALRLSGGLTLNITSLAQLRALLFEMEKTLGLVDLSANERDVLYAINEVSSGSPRSARSEAIRNHPLAAAIPQATYHRALKSLVQRGLVAHAPDTRAGHYVVTESGA
jgi:DNA-binding MarR family transcriptional regulator